MRNDFDQLRNTWVNFGKTEPFWSVITNENFKSHTLSEKSIENFFNTGKQHIDYLEKILNDHNMTFKNNTVLDFGCGIGRLMKNLYPICREVYGMDVSASHLDLAKKHVPGANFYLVDDFEKLPEITEKPDIIYSILTLQHNRPELIKKYSKMLINMLKPSGIALLHIPYKINNYTNFNDDVNRMEMHFISKRDFVFLFDKKFCKVESIIESNNCGEKIRDCIYVVRKM